MVDSTLSFSIPCFVGFDFLTRPLVMQISRWDRLKGFKELLQAFLLIKRQANENLPTEVQEFINKMALVLVGPDPRGVSDDPEASEVLNELIELYQTAEHKDSIAILVLNIENRHENHLLVNAL